MGTLTAFNPPFIVRKHRIYFGLPHLAQVHGLLHVLHIFFRCVPYFMLKAGFKNFTSPLHILYTEMQLDLGCWPWSSSLSAFSYQS